tara:strand:+ start:1927 stop:2310 length:384 start_codon:yes stop_codon:yes gene_type:complete
MKSNFGLFFISLVILFLSQGCDNKFERTTNRLIGHWNSVKLKGGNIEDFYERFEIIFSPDSQLTAIAYMADNTKVEVQGVYSVNKDTLNLKSEHGGGPVGYSFSGDTLIIYDPSWNSETFLLKKSGS